MQRHGGIIGAVGVSLLLAGCASLGGGSGGAGTEIIIAHADNPEHPKQKAFETFKEVVESESDMTVTITHSGTLGGETQLVEAVELGSVHLTSVSNGVMVGFVDDYALLDIPFLFDDVAHARATLDGDFGQEILGASEQAGVVGLAFWEQGFRSLSSNTAVETLEDLQGLKIRTLESPLHVLAWKSMGANATPMGWGEVFTSLQQGVIDGQENPLFVISQEQLDEVQSSATLTRHLYDPMPVVANPEWLDGLGEDDRDVVLEALAQATEEERGLAESLDSEARAELEASGFRVIELSDDERGRFRDAAQPPVVESISDLLGADRVDAFLSGIDN